MAKNLVIVESPAKARTINRYLGRDYIVKSSVGHVRDLPTGGKSERGTTTARKRTKKDAKGHWPEECTHPTDYAYGCRSRQ